MKLNLQSRITLVMWTLSAASTLVAVILIGNLLVRSQKHALQHQLQGTAASLISLGISDFSQVQDFEQLDTFIEDALGMGRVNRIIRVFDKNNRLIFSTIGLEYDPLPKALKVPFQKPQFMEIRGKVRRYEGLVFPYQPKGSQDSFYLQVVAPLPPYRQIFKELFWQGLLFLLLLLVLSLFLSRWLAHRLLRPVENLAVQLKEMEPDRMEAWEPVRIESEGSYLQAITSAVNSMIQKTKEAMFRLRKMSRYVAHEMRTPLTILQGEAETVLLKSDATREDYEGTLRSSLEEVQRLSQTVDSVLEIAETQGGKQPEPVMRKFALDEWLEVKIPAWEKLLNRKIQISKPQESDWNIFSDPELLFLLMDNLIRNVKKHTPEGSACRINFIQEDHPIGLQLEDTGPGLPPNVLQSLNQNKELEGTPGVGLHLCRSVASVLHIQMEFKNLERGGLGVRLIF